MDLPKRGPQSRPSEGNTTIQQDISPGMTLRTAEQGTPRPAEGLCLTLRILGPGALPLVIAHNSGAINKGVHTGAEGLTSEHRFQLIIPRLCDTSLQPVYDRASPRVPLSP